MTGVDGLPNIQFHAALSDVPSAPVSASEIQKVLHNLLINAVEAIQGTGEIQIVLVQQGSEVCIEVRDTGCGISQDFVQNALFKPFRTSKKKGL